MKVLYKKDERVKKEINALAQGTCFILKFGVNEGAKFVGIKKAEKGLIKTKQIEENANVIEFKSLDLAVKVMTGGLGMSTAYCQHAFVLKGSIHDCMCFVRIAELVMAHLLPKKRLKKILREVPDRKISLIKTYVLAIFGN